MVVACDDGVVDKRRQRAGVVACVLWARGPVDVEASTAPLDIQESSSLIAGLALALASRSGLRPRAILLDSLTILGFSVVSPPALRRLSGAPLVAVYKYKPRVENLEAALKKHFPDWRLRLSVLRVLERVERVETRRGELYILPWGLSLEEASALVAELQEYSRTPEPLRLAHSIASELSKLALMRGSDRSF
ncbi:MAG: DUF99 family protein [Acidilobaceae archaeon]